MEQEKKQNKIVNILVNIVFGLIIILTIFISATALTARANDGLPNIGGTSVLTVLTDSMSGTIEKGDLILIELLDAEDPDIQEKMKEKFVVNKTIATFKFNIDRDEYGNMEYVTHRLVGTDIDSRGLLWLIFQGDKNDETTGQEAGYQRVIFYDVVGVYKGTRIPKVGDAMVFMQTSTGFLVVFVLPIFMYFCYQGYKLFITAMEVKRENAVELGKLTADAREEEKRRIREEIMREMNENNKKDE